VPFDDALTLWRNLLRISDKKNPGKSPGFSDVGGNNQLLDFAFLVHHVLAYYRIVLFHFQFVWSRTLVFVSRVEVACAS
jgi:hypothetical protein